MLLTDILYLKTTSNFRAGITLQIIYFYILILMKPIAVPQEATIDKPWHKSTKYCKWFIIKYNNIWYTTLTHVSVLSLKQHHKYFYLIWTNIKYNGNKANIDICWTSLSKMNIYPILYSVITKRDSSTHLYLTVEEKPAQPRLLASLKQ